MVFEQVLPQSVLGQWSNSKRKRIYDETTTLWAWCSQILESNASCHKAVSNVQSWRQQLDLPVPSSQTIAYCEARKRLPKHLIEQANEHVLKNLKASILPRDLWRGLQLKAIDGSSMQIMDTEENQAPHALRMTVACLSEFMKAIKQKFTQWYNKRKGKTGTLWEGRFKSVLVEDGYAARMTAAYIDLNPVRAGMVADPKDYRWCNYGEACAGVEVAQNGLLKVMQKPDGYAVNEPLTETWQEVMGEYRMMMVEEGAAADQDTQGVQGESKAKRRERRNGFSASEIEKTLKNGGKLSAAQMLDCKTRYFTDGVVLGSREFLDRFFYRMKEARLEQHTKRTTGARRFQQVRESKIFSLRDLRKKPLG